MPHTPIPVVNVIDRCAGEGQSLVIPGHIQQLVLGFRFQLDESRDQEVATALVDGRVGRYVSRVIRLEDRGYPYLILPPGAILVRGIALTI
jgi:hypothetical protein